MGLFSASTVARGVAVARAAVGWAGIVVGTFAEPLSPQAASVMAIMASTNMLTPKRFNVSPLTFVACLFILWV
jgi:hypothetical protein